MIKHHKKMFPAVKKIKYYYGIFQKRLFDAVGHLVEFIQGLPKMSDFDGSEPTLIIIDDQMDDCDKEIAAFFTKGAHHCNASVVLVMQNFFHKGSGANAGHIRTSTVNAQYMFLFKNPREKRQIVEQAKQMYADDYKMMVDAYRDATERAHGYILLDFKQDTPEVMRLRTNILPNEQLTVYASKRSYKKDYIDVPDYMFSATNPPPPPDTPPPAAKRPRLV